MHALIFWPKEKCTSVIQSTLINKRLEFNCVTVRWGRKFISAVIIAESEDIDWLESFIVNTSGIITDYVKNSMSTDACIQASPNSTCDTVEIVCGNISGDPQRDSGSTITNTDSETSLYHPDIISRSILHADHSSNLNNLTDNVLNTTATTSKIHLNFTTFNPTVTTTPTTITSAITSFGILSSTPAATTSTNTYLGATVAAVANTIVTASSIAGTTTSTMTPSVTAGTAASITNSTIHYTLVDNSLVTSTSVTSPSTSTGNIFKSIFNTILDYFIPTTTTPTSTTNTTTATNTATKMTTPNEDMVELINRSGIFLKYIELKDIFRFKNKPKETIQRLLSSILGLEQLKHMTVTSIHQDPGAAGIINTVERR